jgi:hypothetical protein
MTGRDCSARLWPHLVRQTLADAPAGSFVAALDAPQGQSARLEVQHLPMSHHRAREAPEYRLDPRHHERERAHSVKRRLLVHRLHSHEAMCKRDAVYRRSMVAALRPTGSRSSKGNLPDVSMAMASSAY